MRRNIFICLALAGITLAVYWPATRYDFVGVDDPEYVTSNVHVQAGLTRESVKWAFLNPVSANWHPVTVLSHMLDCQLYGLKPWGHHLTSLLLQALNTVLVFLFLRSVTGAIWRSVLVAALFGWHPLRVESVAWVAERKDVLSGFFFVLTLLCYAKAVTGDKCQVTRTEAAAATPDSSRACQAEASERRLVTRHASRFYWLAVMFFALGLMSKAMLVTLPLVLLLLDFWPIQRLVLRSHGGGGFNRSTIPRLLLEKWPFFVLAVAASVVTFVMQKQGGAVMPMETIPLDARSGNALISYCRYLGKMFWPTDLAVHYPHPGYWPLEQVLLAGVFLCGISVVLFVKRGRYPFLLVGWLWFIGTLVPVIGLVQVGRQSIADRYTYIPSLGVLILTIWGAYELARRWRHQVLVLSVAGSAVVIFCLALTRQQLGYWKDNETLFRHALEVTENNYTTHYNLGVTLYHKGETGEALGHFQEAIRLRPDYADAHVNLGVVLLNQGQTDEAISQFQEAIRLKPDGADAYYNLGDALLIKGQTDEAIGQFQETIRLKPDDADAQRKLGKALELKSKLNALSSDPAAMNNLAWELATSPDAGIRNGTFAVQLAERACELTHYQITVMIGTLAAAYAEAGRFDDAMATAQKACALAAKSGEPDLLKRNQELLELYRAHKPYHETR